MTGVAVVTNERNRCQALARTWRGIGSRSGGSSSTSGDWRPGRMALAPSPAAIATSAMTPNAPSAGAHPDVRGERRDDDRGAGRARRERDEERGQEPFTPAVQDARGVDGRDVAAGRGEQRDRRPPREPEGVEDPVGQDGGAGQVAGVLERRDDQVEGQHERDADREHRQQPAVERPQERRRRRPGSARASGPALVMTGETNELQPLDSAVATAGPGGHRQPQRADGHEHEQRQPEPRRRDDPAEPIGTRSARVAAALDLCRPARRRAPSARGSRRAAEVIVAAASGPMLPGSRPVRMAGSSSSGDSPARSRAASPPTARTTSGRYGGMDVSGSAASARVSPALGKPDRVGQRLAHPAPPASDGPVDRRGQQLREAPEVELDPVGFGLVGEVGRHDDRQAQVATGEDQRQVQGQVAGVHDRQDRIGPGVEEHLPERRQPVAPIGQRMRARQVDQDRVVAVQAHLPSDAADRRARDVGRLLVATGQPGDERGLPDVRPPDEGDDRAAAGRSRPRPASRLVLRDRRRRPRPGERLPGVHHRSTGTAPRWCRRRAPLERRGSGGDRSRRDSRRS